MKSEKEFKRLLRLTCKHLTKGTEYKRELDDLIIEKYGFHYSDRDIDSIIDVIDCGAGYISFKEFDKLMKESEDD